MNKYLTKLFNTIAIDVNHLKNEFLSNTELDRLDNILKSKQDLMRDFYTEDLKGRLECLLFFLDCHKSDITNFMNNQCKTDTLIELYKSPTISGSYDCFRFDLSKFPQKYTPSNKVITLYRIGRDSECKGNLGCSWATSIQGVKAYCDASCLSKDTLDSRPIFVAKIDDSQVLFEGDEGEHELVLKPNFMYHTLDKLDDELRIKIWR